MRRFCWSDVAADVDVEVLWFVVDVAALSVESVPSWTAAVQSELAVLVVVHVFSRVWILCTKSHHHFSHVFPASSK